MQTMWFKTRRVLATILAGGSLLVLSGCDETIQTTVEDGIINTSSAILNAAVQAAIAAALSPEGA